MDPLNSPSWERLAIPAALYAEMQTHVQQHLPEEACGLLAGTISGSEFLVDAVLPVENMLHSSVRFQMEPYAQLAALNWIDKHGYLLAGIYHSHPNGPPHPSTTDLAEAFYPEAAYLVWYRTIGPDSPGNTPHQHERTTQKAWACRAYRISGGRFAEVEYHLASDEQL